MHCSIGDGGRPDGLLVGVCDTGNLAVDPYHHSAVLRLLQVLQGQHLLR